MTAFLCLPHLAHRQVCLPHGRRVSRFRDALVQGVSYEETHYVICIRKNCVVAEGELYFKEGVGYRVRNISNEAPTLEMTPYEFECHCGYSLNTKKWRQSIREKHSEKPIGEFLENDLTCRSAKQKQRTQDLQVAATELRVRIAYNKSLWE